MEQDFITNLERYAGYLEGPTALRSVRDLL